MKIGLRAKLIIGFLAIGIIPTTLAAVIAWQFAEELLLKEAEVKLTALRDIKAQQLYELLATMEKQTRNLASMDTVKEAAKQFHGAYDSLAKELVEKKIEEKDLEDSLRDFYSGTFAKEWATKNDEKPTALAAKINDLATSSKYLQYQYISNNPNPLGSKDHLIAAEDGSQYANAHRKYHRLFADFLHEFGYYDIFIIDPRTGVIVYSVFKEIDFATSLNNGAYAKSNLAHAFKEAAKAEKDSVIISDLAQYFPSYQAPASFMAAPVYDGRNLAAVIAIQIPIEKIDAIMTNDNKWKEEGFGASGETYLVGKDLLMRSASRFLIEDKAEYLNLMRSKGLSDHQLKYMELKGTPILIQKFDTEPAKQIAQGKAGYLETTDYRDAQVLSAFKPLEIAGLHWGIISEFDAEEALAGVRRLDFVLGFLIVVTALVVLLVAWLFGSKLAKTITAIARSLTNESNQVADASQSIAAGSTELSEAVTEQAASLQETSAAVDEISAIVNKSAENAQTSKARAAESQGRIQEGKKAIEDMLAAIKDINSSNQQIMDQIATNNQEFTDVVTVITEIGTKTKVINDIVFQTKLLSFNASVEAARAGEHGKGFSVVAEEVGNLAQMSGNASREISSLLDESIKKVNAIATSSKVGIEELINKTKASLDNGNKKALHTDKVFDEILKDSGIITSAIDEIARSSQEQSIGIQEVTKAMGQLDQATQQNSTVAQQSSVSAEQLSKQALMLKKIVEELERLIYGKSLNGDTTTQDENQKESEATEAKVLPMRIKSAGPAASATTARAKADFKKAVGAEEFPDVDDPRFEDL